MRRRGSIGVFGLMAALGVAAVGVHAGSAAPSRTTARASTTDATYSCAVNHQHYADLYASVTLPPANNRPQPGFLVLNTEVNAKTQNGTTTSVPQVSVEAVKNGLKIDKSSCRRVKQQIPLKPKGLPGPPTTATAGFRGSDSEQCGTAARVLFRLRLTASTDGTPAKALLAIRNDNTKRRPIAFYEWSPRKFTVYIGPSCVSQG